MTESAAPPSPPPPPDAGPGAPPEPPGTLEGSGEPPASGSRGQHIADGVLRQPDPNSVVASRIASWIFTGIVTFGLLIVLVFSLFGSALSQAISLAATVVIVGFLSWLSHKWPEISYRHTFYKVDPDGLEIRRGVVWRSVTSVPRSRVQHTDVSQGPLERRFDLGTLVVYTAGTDHAQVQLPGLPHARALRIRDHLLPTGGDDAV
jgi:membrane protein YdbS with pleckstrin-like domain